MHEEIIENQSPYFSISAFIGKFKGTYIKSYIFNKIVIFTAVASLYVSSIRPDKGPRLVKRMLPTIFLRKKRKHINHLLL